MNKVLRLARSGLGVCAIAVILIGCGVPQSGLGAMPKSAPGYGGSVAQPDAASCPLVGKTYTTGNDHVEVRFGSAKYFAGDGIRRFIAAFTYKRWPQGKELVAFNAELSTCGPESGKKPIGKIIQGLSSDTATWDCHNGICTVVIHINGQYETPYSLPKGKASWKYDLVRFRPRTQTKGYGVLPGARLEIVK